MATSPSAAPAIIESWGSSVFTGCWNDSLSNRALTLQVTAPGMTLGSCFLWCNPSQIWGVEYGKECYCGSHMPDSLHVRVPDGECNSTCGGNSSQYCGGDWRIAVYSRAAQRSASATLSTSMTGPSTTPLLTREPAGAPTNVPASTVTRILTSILTSIVTSILTSAVPASAPTSTLNSAPAYRTLSGNYSATQPGTTSGDTQAPISFPSTPISAAYATRHETWTILNSSSTATPIPSTHRSDHTDAPSTYWHLSLTRSPAHSPTLSANGTSTRRPGQTESRSTAHERGHAAHTTSTAPDSLPIDTTPLANQTSFQTSWTSASCCDATTGQTQPWLLDASVGFRSATDASEPAGPSGTSSSAGKSAGIACGAIAGITLLVAVGYLALRMRRKAKAQKGDGKEPEWWDQDHGKVPVAPSEGLAGRVRVVRDN